MGSDNLFHKNKKKSAKSLQRRGSRRESYKKVLIVCEGEKTEPYYFEEMREFYSLSTVNVKVRGDCGSDPMSIVKFAKKLYQKSKDASDPFDQIYCVFDKDAHSTYAEALDVLASMTPKNTYFTINSVPCFEYWLLLHFERSARPYRALPSNSAGSQILTQLKKYIPDYEKGRRTTFNDLVDQLPQAKIFAKQILQECERNQTDNPSTRVHELVQFLQSLKS